MVLCGLNCAIRMIIPYTSIRIAVTCLTRVSMWLLEASTSPIFFVSNVGEFFFYGCMLQVFHIWNKRGTGCYIKQCESVPILGLNDHMLTWVKL